jgi:hypothetical protein
MLAYRKGDTACRACNHTFAHHCIYLRLEQGGIVQPFIQPIEEVPCGAYKDHHVGVGKCGCLDFTPMDNLEYLELKAEQAEIKIREQDKDSW